MAGHLPTGKGQGMRVTRVFRGARTRAPQVIAILVAGTILTGCENLEGFSLLQPKDGAASQSSSDGRSTKLIERDVEAPDVFSVTEAGLWDGRPSLGGVWVAHPSVTDPERVIIRNVSNDKFVIGALFRRERDNPGPRLQISSDAAAALGMLAGQPLELNVTALRREEVPQDPAPIETDTMLAPDDISETPLDSIESSAAAAIAAAESAPAGDQPAPTQKPTSSLSKPYIQIGIFSVEANANGSAARMRKAGMTPVVKKQSSKGKTFWRVLVGPAASSSERSRLLKNIKANGFADAYAVTN